MPPRPQDRKKKSYCAHGHPPGFHEGICYIPGKKLKTSPEPKSTTPDLEAGNSNGNEVNEDDPIKKSTSSEQLISKTSNVGSQGTADENDSKSDGSDDNSLPDANSSLYTWDSKDTDDHQDDHLDDHQHGCLTNVGLLLDGVGHGTDFAGYVNGALSISCAPFLNRWEMLVLNGVCLTGATVMTGADMQVCSSHSHDDPGNKANWQTEASALGEFISTWIKTFSLLQPSIDNAAGLKADTPLGSLYVLIFIGAFSLLTASSTTFFHRNINKDNQENNDRGLTACNHPHHLNHQDNTGANTWTKVASLGVFVSTYFTLSIFFGNLLDQAARLDSKTPLGISWQSAAFLAIPVFLTSVLATHCYWIFYTNHQKHHNHLPSLAKKDSNLTFYQSTALAASGVALATDFAASVVLLDDRLGLSAALNIPCYGRSIALLAIGGVLMQGNLQTLRNNLKMINFQPIAGAVTEALVR